MERWGVAVFGLVVVALGAGCVEEEACPEVASSCPEGCHDVEGHRLNEAAACWEEPVVLGCRPEGGAVQAVVLFVRRKATGEVYMFTSGGLPGDDLWEEVDGSALVNMDACGR